MAIEQTVRARHVDQDFGMLELIEIRTRVRVNGGHEKDVIFREWRGTVGNPRVTVGIAGGEATPLVTDEIRSAFRAVVADILSFKQMVARRELGLAREWAAQGGLTLSLHEDALAGLLEISGFSVSEDRLTVWLAESAEILAGHPIEVRIERGEVIEICLAG